MASRGAGENRMTAVENIIDGANGTKNETKALLHGSQWGYINKIPR